MAVRRLIGEGRRRHRPYYGKRRAPRSRRAAGVIRGRERGRMRIAGFYGRYSGATPETKFFDQDINDAAVIANGTIFTNASAESSLLRIAQGNTESTRIGRKITIKSILWRWELTLIATANESNTNDVVRIILYLDKQTNGAAAGITDILETDDFQSFNNLANKSRFRTLMDKTIVMNSSAGSGRGTTDSLSFGAHQRVGTFFKTCNIPIEYDNAATDGSLATIRSNNINMLILSESGLCTFGSKMRLRYADV